MTLFRHRQSLHPQIPRTVEFHGRTFPGKLAPSDLPEAFEVVAKSEPRCIEIRLLYPYGELEKKQQVKQEASENVFYVGANSGRLWGMDVAVPERVSPDNVPHLVESVRDSLRNMKNSTSRAGSLINYEVAEEGLGLKRGTPRWLIEALDSLREEHAGR